MTGLGRREEISGVRELSSAGDGESASDLAWPSVSTAVDLVVSGDDSLRSSALLGSAIGGKCVGGAIDDSSSDSSSWAVTKVSFPGDFDL